MTTDGSIPLEKLQTGFDLCASQMNLLLKASEILIENKLFSMVLPLSILAREELTKLGVMQDHISGQKPIPKSKWNKLTGYGSHNEKLLSLINRKKEFAKTTTPEQWEKIKAYSKKFGLDPIDTSYKDITTINQSVKTNLESLNFIKQDCWYLGWNWKTDDWVIITKEITKHQLEAVAKTHLISLRFLYNYHLFLNYKTQYFLFGQNKTIESKIIEFQEKYKKGKMEIMSSKFAKLNTVAKSVFEAYQKMRISKHGSNVSSPDV